MPRIVVILQVVAFVFTCLTSFPAYANPQYLFKVASLAPEGSVWIKRFREFDQEVRDKSNGEVGFKVYPGGVMGDDRAMFRKMKVGQLHGGGFTMTGIGPVVADFRVMSIPFLFHSYDEVDLVAKELRPRFNEVFADKGLEFIALTEVGFIYTMSTSPIANLDDLKKTAVWTPEGDPVSSAFLEALGVSPIPLSIPDVLTSLQTGMIDTVFNAFYGSIVLQWFTKAKFVANIPFGYAYGAFLLDRKKFSSMPPEYGRIIKEAAVGHFQTLLADTRQSNEEALDVLKKNGVTLVDTDPAALQELHAMRNETVKRIKGDAFSVAIYDETMKLINEYRRP